MLSQKPFVWLALFSSSVSAVALTAAPAATQNSNPQPTEAPNHDLFRRQTSLSSVLEESAASELASISSEFASVSNDLISISTKFASRTLLAGPDQTCGYFGGESSRPWGCSTGNCVFATPAPIANGTQATTAAGSILCCDPSTGCPSSPAPTACIDYNYANLASSSVQTSLSVKSGSAAAVAPAATASVDPMTLTCTSGIYLFCNTLTFATPSASAYFCNYISNTQIQNASTTFSGQSSYSLSLTVPVFAVSTTPTPTPSTSGNGTASATASATAAPSSGGKKKVNGALIGGVVGGVLGLVIWTALVWAFLRWRYSGNGGQAQEEEVGKTGTDTPASEVVVKPVSKA